MDLLEQIEHYLERAGIAPSRFGRMALGDPRFVEDLRRGRLPRPKTLERVEAYLAGHQALEVRGACALQAAFSRSCQQQAGR